jgi:hypothetical protein
MRTALAAISLEPPWGGLPCGGRGAGGGCTNCLIGRDGCGFGGAAALTVFIANLVAGRFQASKKIPVTTVLEMKKW